MDRYDGIRLKLERKKLKSGKCQVKFHWRTMEDEVLYGYLLQDECIPMRQLANEVRVRLEDVSSYDAYYHKPLYSMGNRNYERPEDKLYLYRA